jgi:hypothetical protein
VQELLQLPVQAQVLAVHIPVQAQVHKLESELVILAVLA